MILIPGDGPGFKPITPGRALQYLQNKPTYLSIWNQLIPHYFKAEEFCEIINLMRTKRIETSEKMIQDIAILEAKNRTKAISQQEIFRLKTLNEQKKTIFPGILKDIFNREILPRIKNTDVSYKEVNQLIGSLSNISKTKTEEIQEITEGVNKELHQDLEMGAYKEEILLIMDDLIHQFFTIPETGNQPSEGEKKEFGQKAWSIFLNNHKEEIDQGKIDIRKLNMYLNEKKVI